MKATITVEQQEAIRTFVQSHHLPSGLGTEEEACSIAAINLALSGTLTDTIPKCMSAVMGRWIIGVQDAMPDAQRNADEWKNLLPFAAGTGRDHERERLRLILDWMWTVVLPELLPIAKKSGFGSEWQTMLEKRDRPSAEAAAAAAAAASEAAAARWAADAAAAAAAARWAADAAAAAAAAEAAAVAAAAEVAWEEAAAEAIWEKFAPAKLLRALIHVGCTDVPREDEGQEC